MAASPVGVLFLTGSVSQGSEALGDTRSPGMKILHGERLRPPNNPRSELWNEFSGLSHALKRQQLQQFDSNSWNTEPEPIAKLLLIPVFRDSVM